MTASFRILRFERAAESTPWLIGTGMDRYLPPIFLETNSDSGEKGVGTSVYVFGLRRLLRYSNVFGRRKIDNQISTTLLK